jgi:bifunctional oligoribonuclease and PAP phosphatase NrnA
MAGLPKAEVTRARRRLAAAQHVAVVSHERPDGDAVGSVLAMALSLRLSGRSAEAVLSDGLPGRYRFLPGAASVRRDIPAGVDLVVTVDCSTLDRLGPPAGDLPVINIDHHATNTLFGKINLIDPQASATSELLFDLAPHLRLPIDADVATNLLAGIVTDTIGFRTASTTPRVLQVAADLMTRGAALTEVYDRALNQHSLAALRYWSHGLARLEARGGLVWCALTLEDRRAAEYRGNDDADLINLLGTIDDARVALILVEQSDGRTKVSWRCREGFNVARVAEQFGGGGHDLAAGAMISGERAQVEQAVLAATLAALKAAE